MPCEVIYNKSAEGTIQTLWRANSEAGYCEAQAAGLVDKLEAMGWDCSRVAAPATIEETIDESLGQDAARDGRVHVDVRLARGAGRRDLPAEERRGG